MGNLPHAYPAQEIKASVLAETEGIQFTVAGADIPVCIAVSFKTDFAGKFANLCTSRWTAVATTS